MAQTRSIFINVGIQFMDSMNNRLIFIGQHPTLARAFLNHVMRYEYGLNHSPNAPKLLIQYNF